MVIKGILVKRKESAPFVLTKLNDNVMLEVGGEVVKLSGTLQEYLSDKGTGKYYLDEEAFKQDRYLFIPDNLLELKLVDSAGKVTLRDVELMEQNIPVPPKVEDVKVNTDIKLQDAKGTYFDPEVHVVAKNGQPRMVGGKYFMKKKEEVNA